MLDFQEIGDFLDPSPVFQFFRRAATIHGGMLDEGGLHPGDASGHDVVEDVHARNKAMFWKDSHDVVLRCVMGFDFALLRKTMLPCWGWWRHWMTLSIELLPAPLGPMMGADLIPSSEGDIVQRRSAKGEGNGADRG